MTFKELRKASGMNMADFAKHFNIPYRTVQNWEMEVRKCPEYLLDLMHYKLKKEGFVLIWGQKGRKIMKYRCLFSSRYGKSIDLVVDTASEVVDFVLKYAPKVSKEDAKEIVSGVTLMNSKLLDIDPIYNNKSILIEGIQE